MTDIVWDADVEGEAGIAFRVGRRGDDLVAEWVDKAFLVASRDGAVRTLDFAPGLDDRLRAKIEQGAAWLLVRSLRNEGLGLHGAAISVHGVAVILLGRSGSGKSTLGAELTRSGVGSLLADDAIALERQTRDFVVLPRERDLWLDAAACAALGFSSPGAGKRPQPATVATAACPLRALIDLRFEDDDVNVRPASGIEAMACLVPQVVRFALDDESRKRSELDALHDLATTVPAFVLRRPRRLGDLAKAGIAIAALARSLI